MPVPKSEPKRVKRDKHAEEMADLRKSIERKELQAKAGKLDVELKGIDQTLTGPKMKSVEELLYHATKSRVNGSANSGRVDAFFADCFNVRRNIRSFQTQPLRLRLESEAGQPKGFP